MNLRSRFKVITYNVLALLLICATLLTLCFFGSFDKTLGYFEGDSSLPYLFRAAYTVAIAFILISCYLYIKCKKMSTEDAILPPFFKVICLSVGALALIYSVYGLAVALITSTAPVYTVISYIGALAFGGFLICAFAKGGFEYSGAKLALLCLSVFFPLGLAMKNVIYLFRPSNSVENILSAVISISLLIYILNEGKRMTSGTVTRAYPASLLLSLFSSATLSASYIAGYIGSAVNEVERFRDMLLCLALSIYFACALFTFIASVKEKNDSEKLPEDEAETEAKAETETETKAEIETEGEITNE